jgi:hypothetical protein
MCRATLGGVSEGNVIVVAAGYGWGNRRPLLAKPRAGDGAEQCH